MGKKGQTPFTASLRTMLRLKMKKKSALKTHRDTAAVKSIPIYIYIYNAQKTQMYVDKNIVTETEQRL